MKLIKLNKKYQYIFVNKMKNYYVYNKANKTVQKKIVLIKRNKIK